MESMSTIQKCFYRVSVKAFIKNQDGKVLVVKENQDTWSLPGGGLDHGEEPLVGLARELHEEIGITAEIGDIIDVRSIYFSEKGRWGLWIVYETTVTETHFTLGEGVTHASFVASDELSNEDKFEMVIKELLESQ